jgi:hypothetical protein
MRHSGTRSENDSQRAEEILVQHTRALTFSLRSQSSKRERRHHITDLGSALGLSFVIVRLNLVVFYECFPQIFIRQPSSMTEEESKSRHNRYPI